MFRSILIALLILSFSSCSYDAITGADLQEGDILFQDLDCGDACDAIEKVTRGYNALDFSHCGIVATVDGKLKVVEAYGDVQAVEIDTFLHRSTTKHGYPKVLVGRPKEQGIARLAASESVNYIGKEYDKEFRLDNDKYYCSELVYECFMSANNNEAYFPLNKMTFKEPDSTDYVPYWVEYYKELGVPIPEGELGINPGAISMDPHLEMILIR